MFWGPLPVAWLWVGSQVDYLTGSTFFGMVVAFLGLLATLVVGLMVMRRLDLLWILARRAGGHDQREGIIGRVFAVLGGRGGDGVLRLAAAVRRPVAQPGAHGVTRRRRAGGLRTEMALRDYYRQFEGMTDREVSDQLRERSRERRRRALAKIDPLDLSVTTWHEFPHPDVVAAITYAARRGINRYSDPQAMELRREIGAPPRPGERASGGRATGSPSCCSATAAHADRAGRRAGHALALLSPLPADGARRRWARGAGAGGGPEAVLSAVTERTRLLALCNPNDPTGAYLPADRLRELLGRLPERVTVLLDEALIDFVDAEAPGASIDLLDDFPRLLVFRTFSKAYGLASMRCGYALGGPGSEELIERIAPPLGVSVLAHDGSAGGAAHVRAAGGRPAQTRSSPSAGGWRTSWRRCRSTPSPPRPTSCGCRPAGSAAPS